MMNQDKRKEKMEKIKEAGVTLILAVMIMSGILIIVTTVSILAVQEIRGSRASSLSEPAIVAAESSGEQGIWMIKRSSFSTPCPAATSTQIDGTTSASNSTTLTTKCVTYDKATFDVSPSEPASFFLYDPADINGNLCMYSDDASLPGPCDGQRIYKNIVFIMTNGAFSATATAETLDGVLIDSVTVPSDGNPGIIVIPDTIVGSSDQRIIVTMTSTVNATIGATTSGGFLSGLPDYPTIDAEGCAGTGLITSCNDNSEIFKRRINITVPK